MSKIRLALVSLSAVAFVLCLGLFSARATSWASPSAAPAVQTAPAAQRCQATSDTDDDALIVPAATSCPAGTVFVKCPCGGEGCRPRNISPANWCGC